MPPRWGGGADVGMNGDPPPNPAGKPKWSPECNLKGSMSEEGVGRVGGIGNSELSTPIDEGGCPIEEWCTPGKKS